MNGMLDKGFLGGLDNGVFILKFASSFRAVFRVEARWELDGIPVVQLTDWRSVHHNLCVIAY